MTGARDDAFDWRPVVAADGSRVAMDLVGPVFRQPGCDRTRGPGSLRRCRTGSRVFNYDRRGRGESGDTTPYAVEREIEDLDALIAEAGGSAAVFGYSSGANLALQAAAHGLAITKLALYEPPFLVDGSQSSAAGRAARRSSPS